MGKQQHSNLLQGTLDLLILKALALGELHGLGISRRVEQMTRGTFQVKPGSPLSGFTPDGRGRVAELAVGRIGEQPEGQVLRADQGRKIAARRGEVGVGPDFGSDSVRVGELAKASGSLGSARGDTR